MTSILTLNNNMPEASVATVTVFNSKGEPFLAPPIELQSQTAAQFSLRELTRDARGDFNSGSVQVFYHGPSMAVTCQVSITSESKRISFESVEASAMEFESSTLDGIVWIPDDGTRPSVALTNTTPNILTVKMAAGQEPDRKVRTITLDGQEMRVIDLREFVDSKRRASDLLRVEHNSAPGALVATGFALNEQTGFSCTLPFIDRSTAKTTHLAGAHVRFGRPDAKEGFPSGTSFIAPLVIANAGDSSTEARVFVDYTAGSAANRIDLGAINLATQETKQIELSKEMARRGVTGPVEDAGVDIEYTGKAGAVIGRLTSVDKSGDFSFDVPVKDPLAETLRVSGGYPWRIDGGYITVVHLKNTIDKPVYALVQVRYEGGSYNIERIKMAAYQTVAVDIKQLRDAEQQDIRGTVMPKDVDSGQVVWFEEEAGSLIGRAEVAKIAAGVASSFSCSGNCTCPPNYYSAYLTPSSSVGAIGGTDQFTQNEMRKDCNNVSYGPYNRTSDSTWSSSNTNVMTVSAGLVSCLNPGTAGVTAQFQAVIYGGPCGLCCPTYISLTTGANVTVFRLRIRVAGSSIHFEDSDSGASIVAGEPFALIVEAVDANGNVLQLPTNPPVHVTTSASRTLGSTETGLPSTFDMQGNGTYNSPGVVFNRVNGTESGTSYRFSTAGGGIKDFSFFTYFRVTMDVERWKNCGFTSCPNPGSYICRTACGPGLLQPTAFVSLTSTGLCNRAVTVGTSGGVSQLTTVREVGPRTTDAYWNTGMIPIFDPNNKPATLGGCLSDVLMNNLSIPNGCSFGEAEIFWRF